MNRIIAFCLTFISISSANSQVISNEYVVTTVSRDKVFIVNTEMGQLIYSNWQVDPVWNGIKPEVYLVNDLAKYRKKYAKNKKKK